MFSDPGVLASATVLAVTTSTESVSYSRVSCFGHNMGHHIMSSQQLFQLVWGKLSCAGQKIGTECALCR